MALGIDQGGGPGFDVCCHRALGLTLHEVDSRWRFGGDAGMILYRVGGHEPLITLILLPVVLLSIRLQIRNPSELVCALALSEGRQHGSLLGLLGSRLIRLEVRHRFALRVAELLCLLMSHQVGSLVLLVAELSSLVLDLGLTTLSCSLRVLWLLILPHAQTGLARYPVQAA